jgi:hypothetical protein
MPDDKVMDVMVELYLAVVGVVIIQMVLSYIRSKLEIKRQVEEAEKRIRRMRILRENAYIVDDS